jgi:hypothetical protein
MGDTASANSLYVATEPFWLQFLPALAKCVGHNSQMKTVLLFALWCFSALAYAQIYQCPGASGVVFQQAPCAGGSKLQDKVEPTASASTSAKQNSPNARERLDNKASSAPGASPEPEGSFACPSAFEIRNAETSAASITLRTEESIAQKALVMAMKKCPRKITCAEILKISPDKKTAYAAAQRYAKLFDPNKQPYLQLDRDRDGKSCESYR